MMSYQETNIIGNAAAAALAWAGPKEAALAEAAQAAREANKYKNTTQEDVATNDVEGEWKNVVD